MAFPVVKFGDFTFTGASTAGIFTSLACKELKLAFDVANGPSFLLGTQHFFITHGHADHAAGIPYLLSMKALAKHKTAHVYVPEPLLDPLEQIIHGWESIENHKYNFELHSSVPSSRFPLKGSYYVRPFPTFHRVASNGYTVFQTKKRLSEEFKGKSRTEILEAKGRGIDIESREEIPLISFTGDTTTEFLDASPWVLKSQTLFVEVSFIDKARTIDETRHWGHIHFDELLPRIQEFQGEHLVLIHLSARYSTSQFETLLRDKLSPELLQKVTVFPRFG